MMKFTQKAITSYRAPAGKVDHIDWDDEMPGFGIRTQQGGHPRYLIQYRMGTQQRRYVIGAITKLTLEAARKLARDKFTQIADGLDPKFDRDQRNVDASIVFDDALIDDFLAAQRKRDRSTSHLDATGRYLKKHFKPLHGRPLSKISRADVAGVRKKIGNERGLVAADRAQSAISKFFKWARSEGVVEDNPVMGIEKYNPKPRRPARKLDTTELPIIWKALPDDDYGWINKLAMMTGQRRSEIAKLQVEWIDFNKRVIVFPGFQETPDGIVRVKNGAEHHIPMSPTVYKILRGLVPRDGSRKFVFGRFDTGFSGFSRAKKQLNEDTKDLGLKRWTLHSFRKSFSTSAREEIDVLPHIVEAITNHISGDDKGGVAGIYNEANYMRQKREALDKWDAYVTSLLKAGKANVVPFTRAA